MKKALAGVLAVALAGLMIGSASAQVPNVQVYFDPAFTQTQTNCPAGPPTFLPVSLYVVMNNWNMQISGVDFSIDFSLAPSLAWVADNPTFGSATIGNSPTGIAVGWGICCIQDGFQPVLALEPQVIWGPCDCQQGPQAIVVRGYTAFGKTQPTATRFPDYQEFTGVGMTSLICPGAIATEQSTWGGVKALYR